jgi:hypothetical protein
VPGAHGKQAELTVAPARAEMEAKTGPTVICENTSTQ